MNTISQLARLSASQCRYKQAGQPSKSKGLGRIGELLQPDVPTPKPKPKIKPPKVTPHKPNVAPDAPLKTPPPVDLPAGHVATPGAPAQFGSPVVQKKPLVTRIKDVVTEPFKGTHADLRRDMGLGPDQPLDMHNLVTYMSGKTGPNDSTGLLRDYSLPLTKTDRAKAYLWPQVPKALGGKKIPAGLTMLGLYQGVGRPTYDAYSEVKKVYNDPFDYFDVKSKKTPLSITLGAAAEGLTPERQQELESRARDSFEFIVQSSVKDYFGVGKPAQTMADRAVFGGFREAVWGAGAYAAGQGLEKREAPGFNLMDVARASKGGGPYMLGELGGQLTRQGFESVAPSQKPDFAKIMQRNIEKGYEPVLTQLRDESTKGDTPALIKDVVEDYVKSDVHEHLEHLAGAFEGMDPEEIIVEVGRKHGIDRATMILAYRAALAAVAAAAAEAARRAGGAMSGGGTPSRSKLITGQTTGGSK